MSKPIGITCPHCKDTGLPGSAHCEMCYQCELAGFQARNTKNARINIPSGESPFWDSRKGQEIIRSVSEYKANARKSFFARAGGK